MSSANNINIKVILSNVNPQVWSPCKNNSKSSINNENKAGEIISPYFKPTAHSKKSEYELHPLTQVLTLLYISLIIRNILPLRPNLNNLYFMVR